MNDEERFDLQRGTRFDRRLYHLLDRGDRVKAISFDYGQNHNKELEFALSHTRWLGVEHEIADVSALRPILSAGATYPGNYEEVGLALPIPNRNMLMIAVALSWAISKRADAITYAAHAGGSVSYPDCRPDFVRALSRAVGLCDEHRVELDTPFIAWTKTEIVAEGLWLNVPLEETWSCYRGGEFHCGHCGACTDRREAFSSARVADPTRYAHKVDALSPSAESFP